MRVISSSKRREFAVLFIIFLVISETIAYMAITPRPGEQFFELYVLGVNRSVGGYYPYEDPNIRIGDSVHWYIKLKNSMNTVQLVAIRVKLGNQSTLSPDILQATSSLAPTVVEFKRVITNNETWELPFNWQITNGTFTEGSTRILEVKINNQTYPVPSISAIKGYNFRLILELWTWNIESNTFEYGWSLQTERRTAWLQVWFNMTMTTTS